MNEKEIEEFAARTTSNRILISGEQLWEYQVHIMQALVEQWGQESVDEIIKSVNVSK